ncbi:Zn(2)-C6 fungal-type domain-containing protein [Mycena chlorophos]|uniref:Zn(2)-C6 fungal-type domain-containing protein n=1 Tax=Mycena chlorophos TaxID=658473 RepID=A0A8H6VSJ7_MYCCL|nr:Zn(2)-C6 fungal-type domain-containing protein [Mycena chlorophos]
MATPVRIFPNVDPGYVEERDLLDTMIQLGSRARTHLANAAQKGHQTTVTRFLRDIVQHLPGDSKSVEPARRMILQNLEDNAPREQRMRRPSVPLVPPKRASKDAVDGRDEPFPHRTSRSNRRRMPPQTPSSMFPANPRHLHVAYQPPSQTGYPVDWSGTSGAAVYGPSWQRNPLWQEFPTTYPTTPSAYPYPVSTPHMPTYLPTHASGPYDTTTPGPLASAPPPMPVSLYPPWPRGTGMPYQHPLTSERRWTWAAAAQGSPSPPRAPAMSALAHDQAYNPFAYRDVDPQAHLASAAATAYYPTVDTSPKGPGSFSFSSPPLNAYDAYGAPRPIPSESSAAASASAQSSPPPRSLIGKRDRDRSPEGSLQCDSESDGEGAAGQLGTRTDPGPSPPKRRRRAYSTSTTGASATVVSSPPVSGDIEVEGHDEDGDEEENDNDNDNDSDEENQSSSSSDRTEPASESPTWWLEWWQRQCHGHGYTQGAG